MLSLDIKDGGLLQNTRMALYKYLSVFIVKTKARFLYNFSLLKFKIKDKIKILFALLC